MKPKDRDNLSTPSLSDRLDQYGRKVTENGFMRDYFNEAQTAIEADLLGLLPEKHKPEDVIVTENGLFTKGLSAEKEAYNQAIQEMTERIRDYCRGKL